MNGLEIVEHNEDDLKKITKAELIEIIIAQDGLFMVISTEALAAKDKLLFSQRSEKETEAKLEMAETYVEQARTMILSIMEGWHHYDD